MACTIYVNVEFLPFILVLRLLTLLNLFFVVLVVVDVQGSWHSYAAAACADFVRDFSKLASATFYFDLALGHVRHEILRIYRNNRYCLDEH